MKRNIPFYLLQPNILVVLQIHLHYKSDIATHLFQHPTKLYKLNSAFHLHARV